MKKLITLIITLLAIAAGAKADDRTVISVVEATSNPNWRTIPANGMSVTQKPTITVTKGQPAYFTSQIDNNGRWMKKTDDGWEIVFNGTFTPGTWRYQDQVRIDDEAGKTHVLSESLKVIYRHKSEAPTVVAGALLYIIFI